MKSFSYIYNKVLAMAVVLLLTLAVNAQESSTIQIDSLRSRVLHSTLYGVGWSNVLDTYLSPYNYTGVDVRVMRETMRPTKLMGGHIHYQTFIDVDASYLENRSNTANEYAGGIRYSNAWLYKFDKTSVIDVYAGLQPSVYLGGVYNTRNGNNPAQAKFDIMLNATAIVQYDLHLFRRVFPVRYQLTAPLLGAAFEMNYGQSYYELFGLCQYDHNVVFAYPGNMPSMRHLITVDIPIKRNYLRLGYSGEFNQATFNNLRYHSYSHNFMIGFTKYFYRH